MAVSALSIDTCPSIGIAISRTPPRTGSTTRRLRSGRSDGAACSRVVLQGESQLQRLLLAALHNLFPQLALVLHALQLRESTMPKSLGVPCQLHIRLRLQGRGNL